jgi:YVTN family beta-propeller protein
MKGVYFNMRLRQLFRVVPLFFITAIASQFALTTDCHAEAFAYIPYISDTGDGSVSVVKVLDNSITDTIDLGLSGGPYGVAANPSNQDYVYVTNYNDGTASAISVSYNTVVKTLNVGPSPRGIAITSDGAFIYVANFIEGALGTVSAKDISSGSDTPPLAITIGHGPLGVAISPKQDYIYVTNNLDDSLSIISADTKELFVTLANHYYINYSNSSSDVAFNKPYGVAVSPDSNYIYVVNNGDGISNGTVSILSAAVVYSQGTDFTFSDYDATSDTSGPYALSAPITVGIDPRGIVVTPDQKYLYVTNYGDDTVSVINLSTAVVDQTIPVGDGPFGISVTPSGDFVYVVNNLSGNVSVIYTNHGGAGAYTDYSVTATVAIGNSPIGFGNFIGGKPPRAPTSLTATLEKDNIISIAWSDNSNDELGFKIFRKQYIGGSYSLLATVDKNTISYTDDSDLKSDSNYYYQVCAYNYAGNSTFSNETYATTGTSSSGCFIATAAYGSRMEPHVQILRDFRDRFLSTNMAGKGFLNLYYKYSPPVAHFIAKHDGLRLVIRWCLLPFVGISWLVMLIGPVSTALLMGSFVFLLIFSFRLLIRKAAREEEGLFNLPS